MHRQVRHRPIRLPFALLLSIFAVSVPLAAQTASPTESREPRNQLFAGYGHLNSNWWGGEFPGHTNSFIAQAGAGIDKPISPRIAWRIEGGFFYANFTIPDDQIHNLPNYFARISTGLVYRF